MNKVTKIRITEVKDSMAILVVGQEVSVDEIGAVRWESMGITWTTDLGRFKKHIADFEIVE